MPENPDYITTKSFKTIQPELIPLEMHGENNTLALKRDDIKYRTKERERLLV